MGVARSIGKVSGTVTILILCACVGVSILGTYLAVFPRVVTILERAAGKYDSIFPEITILNGHASIREKQPHFLDNLGEKDLVLVIDTREGSQEKALNYLKEAQAGAVLTGRTIVTKNQGEVRIISLKEIPDMVLNSENIKAALQEYLPSLTWWATLLVAIYFLFAKPVQIVFFAIIPYLGARTYSIPLTYGEATKIAAVGMVVPVTVEFFYNFMDPGISTSVFIYFLSYVIVLILAVRDLVRESRQVDTSEAGIHPS